MASIPLIENLARGPLNDWRGMRTSAGLGLREVARSVGVSSTYMSHIESGKDAPSASAAVRLARLYKAEVVLARWFAETYDAREYLEMRFVFHPEHGLDVEYFDPGDPGESEWVTDADASDGVKQGMFLVLSKQSKGADRG